MPCTNDEQDSIICGLCHSLEIGKDSQIPAVTSGDIIHARILSADADFEWTHEIEVVRLPNILLSIAEQECKVVGVVKTKNRRV